jgi:hypothetical protein
MEFYVISPVSNLEPMKLGDRIFVLAHLWVQFPEYREFIKARKEEGYWITLDNSAAERALVTEDVLINICKELLPDEVIAPDVLFNKDATIANAISFRERMQAEGLKDLFHIDIFFCPQGKTKEDWLEAYEWGINQDWIDVIGFSKIAIPQAWLEDFKDDQGIKEARHMAYDYLNERDMLKKPIHCLGQGDPTEFSYYKHPMMRSTDSVYPVWAAINGQDFRYDTETRTPTPHKLLEEYDMKDVDMDLVKKNVQYLRLSCMPTDY